LIGNGFSGFLLNPSSEIKGENLWERQRRYSIQGLYGHFNFKE
jgi:hypothetical protein